MIELDTSVEKQEEHEDFEELNFGNVQLRMHPNGDIPAWNRIGHGVGNVQLRLFLKDRLHDIDLSRVYLIKCLDCIVRDYNPGIIQHLCTDSLQCAAVFPDVSDHVKMGFKPGQRASKYRSSFPQLEDNYFA